MSFGTLETFKSKKALKEAVAQRGAEDVVVFDTSMFGNRGRLSLAELVDTSAMIVGPNVHTDRRWYANVKRNPKTGVITVV